MYMESRRDGGIDMEQIEVHREYETLKEHLGAEAFLEELYQAMTTDDAHVLFEFIARMNDIDL